MIKGFYAWFDFVLFRSSLVCGQFAFLFSGSLAHWFFGLVSCSVTFRCSGQFPCSDQLSAVRRAAINFHVLVLSRSCLLSCSGSQGQFCRVLS